MRDRQKSLAWRQFMSLINSQGVTETEFDAVNVEDSVQESLVSTLVMSGSDQDGARETDVRLPVNQIVRLMKDIPELSLRCGELGVVISVWCAPIVAYEVEFYQPDGDCGTRVLVFGKHLQAEPVQL